MRASLPDGDKCFILTQSAAADQRRVDKGSYGLLQYGIIAGRSAEESEWRNGAYHPAADCGLSRLIRSRPPGPSRYCAARCFSGGRTGDRDPEDLRQEGLS